MIGCLVQIVNGFAMQGHVFDKAQQPNVATGHDAYYSLRYLATSSANTSSSAVY
jgi:hypothetical protein